MWAADVQSDNLSSEWRVMNMDQPSQHGHRITLTGAPQELLEGLLLEDQEAVTSLVGKTGIFIGVDKYGYLEIEFDHNNEYRTIFVKASFVSPI